MLSRGDRQNDTEPDDGGFHSHYSPMFIRPPGSIWLNHSTQPDNDELSENVSDDEETVNTQRGLRGWHDTKNASHNSSVPHNRSTSTPMSINRNRLPVDDATRSYVATNDSRAAVAHRYSFSARTKSSGHHIRNRQREKHPYNSGRGNQWDGRKFVGDDPFDSSDDSCAPELEYEKKRQVSNRKKAGLSASSDGLFTSKDFAVWLPSHEAGDMRSAPMSSATRSSVRDNTSTTIDPPGVTTRISTQIKLGFQRVKSYLRSAMLKIKQRIMPICSANACSKRRGNRAAVKKKFSDEPLLQGDTYSRSFEYGR